MATNTPITTDQQQKWLQLYSHTDLPVVVQHPAWVLNMLKYLAVGNPNVFPAIASSATGDKLRAAALLERQSLARGYLLPVAATWDCGFLFSGQPLLDSSDLAVSLQALLATAGSQAGAVLLRKIPFSGPVYAALQKLNEEGIIRLAAFDVHDRAALHCDQSFADWYQQNFSSKRRKEYRRLEKRLAELGTVAVDTWQPGQAIEPWVEDFLALEAAGWKGRRGTAVASDPGRAKFIRSALPELANLQQLLFWRITLDGKTIATLFAFVAGSQVLLGKIAYSEELARFSPGVMLIFAASKDLMNSGRVLFVDSAADPDHPMIDKICRDRVRTGDLLISLPGAGKFGFQLRVLQESMRRALRGAAKAAYLLIKRS